MITDLKKLIGGNSQIGICGGDRKIELSVHGVKGLVLSGTDHFPDEIYGDVFHRALYIIQEVKVNGNKEIRRVQINLFSDEPESIKIVKGHIVKSIHEETRIKAELDKEGS